MAGEYSGRRNSNPKILEELESLSQSLYQSHTSTNRRTNSLALPRSSVPPVSSIDPITTSRHEEKPERPRSRRMSLSPWRSRPKLDDEHEPADQAKGSSGRKEHKMMDEKAEKKGIWNWKPIRVISHIGMQKLSCLFSVEVVTVQDLPASMNGLRLSVCVRKKETKEGAVQTMPARVLQGAADFEETLFIRCHVYCSSSGSGKHLKFEPRPFLIYVFAVDAKELDFGRSSVDLSLLVQESMEKNLEGTRVRQWDTSFNLLGKAKGGELVVKLGFQIMEKDGGLGIYSQAEGLKSGGSKDSSSLFARKQSKSSFSVPSPKMSSRAEASVPSKTGASSDFHGIDDFNLDEPAPVPSSTSSVQKSGEPESKIEDLDLPDFEVVDRGIEIQDKSDAEEENQDGTDEKSVSSEIVKEVVHDQVHLMRLTELDSIAQQIKALESMMADENSVKADEETESQRLDADEENITMEFLHMLEEEGDEFKLNQQEILTLQLEGAKEVAETESKVYLPDLGKGLGCIVQTRDGGYLASMNPLDIEVVRKETPKLAMQISKPLILPSQKSLTGFEVFQRMAAIGLEELSSEILSYMPVDELIGKTAEQIAFEGIASAIIQGRNKEGASSTAARTISTVKNMATAMSIGRKERISTGIWNVNGDPVTKDEILAFAMQKIESMAVEALKIQAGIAEEEAPFEVFPLVGKMGTTGGKDPNHPLASAVPLDNWLEDGDLAISQGEPGIPETVTISVVVQLRDPLRRYEAVGGPVIALVQATREDSTLGKDEERFKVASLHVGGLKVSARGKSRVWDAEKQRLTAMQWLVAYGLAKAGKKGKQVRAKGQDSLWSISSRIMADMWLKPMRNPDIKNPKQQ
ncbi:EEIG1/EHBP1 N-terminal domain [Macleaya cordata]|uniref:EEIG1/EHBP1 N-terminal domain n=1 Tax=Macleaya cordata TaxID=56857 RepID=A0A200PSC1_MACCD|nr:EEIG1/EHBP1 N-terminal domain [Macleaya cordata]